MISVGSLVRTAVVSHAPPYANLPIGTVCLVISAPYEVASRGYECSVIDILFEGESRPINIHNVVEVQ